MQIEAILNLKINFSKNISTTTVAEWVRKVESRHMNEVNAKTTRNDENDERTACSFVEAVEIDETKSKVNETLRERSIVVAIHEEEIDADFSVAKNEATSVFLILDVLHVELMIDDENCMQVDHVSENINQMSQIHCMWSDVLILKLRDTQISEKSDATNEF